MKKGLQVSCSSQSKLICSPVALLHLQNLTENSNTYNISCHGGGDGYISISTRDIKLESGGTYEAGDDWIREDGWKHG